MSLSTHINAEKVLKAAREHSHKHGHKSAHELMGRDKPGHYDVPPVSSDRAYAGQTAKADWHLPTPNSQRTATTRSRSQSTAFRPRECRLRSLTNLSRANWRSMASPCEFVSPFSAQSQELTPANLARTWLRLCTRRWTTMAIAWSTRTARST